MILGEGHRKIVVALVKSFNSSPLTPQGAMSILVNSVKALSLVAIRV
jgi:hypothetical protein